MNPLVRDTTPNNPSCVQGCLYRLAQAITVVVILGLIWAVLR